MRKLSGLYKTDRNKNKKFSIEVPGTWEELAPGQFGTAIYLLQVTTQADPGWIKLSLLTLLFEKHCPVLNGISDQDRETLLNGALDEHGNSLFEGLPDFFYQTEPPLLNYFSKLKTRSGVLIPSATDLSNIGFGEWCFLDTCFEFYFRSQGDDKWLNQMIATVYRSADPAACINDANYSGDLRHVFNENLVDIHAGNINSLPKNVKMGIFQWIAIALKKVKADREDVFPQVQTQVDQDGKPLPIANEGGSWMDIYRDLLGPKFGTTDQLKKTNAMFVLDYLNKEQINWKQRPS